MQVIIRETLVYQYHYYGINGLVQILIAGVRFSLIKPVTSIIRSVIPIPPCPGPDLTRARRG
jgi:hypothetical protein